MYIWKYREGLGEERKVTSEESGKTSGMFEKQEKLYWIYNSVKGKEKKTRDEVENRGKDKMMKSTTIMKRNMAFILSILQNQWGKDEEARTAGSSGERWC